jgi:serine/threonine protein kinase
MKVIQHEKSIVREKNFINDTKKLKHDHLVKCYASWKFGAKYHMIYELAECNLEEFIQKMKDPKDHPALNNAWLIKQMCGLAGALRAVHTQEEDVKHTSNDNRLDVPKAPKSRSRSGYIHDIKPDNILVFLYGGSVHWFRLSDFSCAKVVDFVASISGQHVNSHLTTSKTGAPDYRPPESMKGTTSRPYDLWSLGCVYLELIVWFLQGYSSLEAFRAYRRGNVRPHGVEDEAFYFTDEVNANPRVQLRWAVVEKISELSRICPSDLRPLLDVIPSLLHIDPGKRPTAMDLVQQLGQLDTSTPFELSKASSKNTKTLNVPNTAKLDISQNEDSGSESDSPFVVVHKPTDNPFVIVHKPTN